MTLASVILPSVPTTASTATSAAPDRSRAAQAPIVHDGAEHELAVVHDGGRHGDQQARATRVDAAGVVHGRAERHGDASVLDVDRSQTPTGAPTMV